MHVSIIASATLFCAGAIAAPVETRDGGNVYITTDDNWGHRETSGLHELFPVQGWATCVDLQDTPWDKSISSFGPSQSIKCVIYEQHWCNGDGASLPVWYGGYAKLDNFGWDNKVSAYRCGPCTVGVDAGCLG